MTRCARERRVFFVEEPVFDADGTARLAVTEHDGVHVAVPHLPSVDAVAACELQRVLIDDLIARYGIDRYILWYYTPMALRFAAHLTPLATIYDCMDELSAFANAPPALKQYEAELLRRATLVLTGGQSLYEAKRDAHPSVYAFPSSVDVAHFGRARLPGVDPPDQARLAHPRLGFFGVIDERLDIELLDGVAAARPGWQIVLVGPIAKIDPAVLPQGPNIHYLGAKQYTELPAYLAGWDVALIPFARNEATRFISPTKTPEYLAAGVPVVSTSIRDVVRPYGQCGLARIADAVPEFVAACEAAMAEDPVGRRTAADAFLRQTSWDGTWMQIGHLLEVALGEAADSAKTA
ncbi:MAG: glycosyltransferase [Vicinamibacterales bacterium]